MPEAVATKLCTVCGIDCSKRARVKDQQGRYMCQECFDRAKQTKQVQNAPPPAPISSTKAADLALLNDNSFLLDMGGKSVEKPGVKSCPECGRGMSANAVVCIGCGYNSQSGKRLSLKIEKPKKIKEPGSGGGGTGIDLSSGPMILLVVIVSFGVAGGLCVLDPTLGLVASVVVSAVVGIWMLIECFKVSLLAGILSVFVPLAGIIVVLFFAEDTRVRWALLGSILGNVLIGVLMGLGVIPTT
jgi:uncharacterized membrane protein (GlpM family)